MVELLDKEFGGKGKQVIWRGKKLGYLIPEKFGYTFVALKKKEHFFRQYLGYALNKQMLEYFKQIGVKKIILKVRGKKNTEIYTSTIDKWFNYGITYRHPNYEPQLVLPIKYMEAHVIK
ncbi:MAG: hypothetical protein DRJ31_03165 [Candidatus Methanomethylicota archaeon]|uniref:Uncharacterized protein n=1 Tax=Thermoproteota archaeon TaxID=2056631 RepID=A0A497ESL1_9CREN|nr:MAG: hypothetical protein DRJ31_03165 [Candidatus Verstraetearchaeota archaeon]HDH44504.1 hypothetical protein [Thermococcus sp.]